MHLLPYTSILLTASAAYLPLQPRVDPCVPDISEGSIQQDGTSADGTAGIGAEFESPGFGFVNVKCSPEDTYAARKQIVAERTGLNWQLTADTGGDPGKLNAEYILNGANIKVGSGDGPRAIKAWVDDLIAWKPWVDPPRTVDIANSNCNPWTINTGRSQKPEKLPWAPQITTPMPLEALYSLMKENQADPAERNPLDGYGGVFKLVVVKQEYFQSNKNGIDQSKVTDDVLGFCSLVLSYAKAASKELSANESPKLRVVFMPRTEFKTIYGQVKSKLPGDLFSLFNSLACYQTNANGDVEVDSKYCSGSVGNPIPNNEFSDLSYANTEGKVNIKDWIEDIPQGDSPDALSKFDQTIDGSIGGFGTTMEKMYNSQRSVPIFEFRDLQDLPTSKAEDFMNRVDSAIQDLHNTFGTAPSRKRDIPASCFTTTASDATTPTSTAPAQSSTPTPTPPYAPGVCSFHMTYWRPQFWPDGTNPYEIEIRIKDNNKATIGWLEHTNDDNKYSWNVNSRLEDPLAVTPESQGDYVQFTLPGQSWRTDKATDGSKIPNCSTGDWDCSDDPCYRQLDCSFGCVWHGGPSSDGGPSKINY